MSPDLIRIDIERVVNLVAGFGWKKVEEKIEPGKVKITLEKAIEITTEP
ncbi:hypothetical protein ES702_05658 [subsurface metagenome]